MSRIVINPEELADTASLLAAAAGEYQAIGAHVAGCNCGCMPADVAATVDAVTAAVRGALQGVAGELSEQASSLAWRAGVDQGGATSGAISAAWGGGVENASTMTIGGFDGSLFGSTTGGSTLVIGGYDPSSFVTPIGGSILTIGGTNFDVGGSGGGANLIIGGTNLFSPATGGGMTLTIYPEPLPPPITLGPTGDPFLDDTARWLESLRPASRNLAASGFRFNGPNIFDVMTAQANSTLNWTVSGGEYRYNYGEHSNFFYRPGELYGTRS
jgi:hypothetical protein